MTDADATSFIPFNRLSLMGSEEEHVLDALRSGHVSGDGAYTKKCKAWFEERLGVPSALLTTSCTHALEMSAILLNIQPGDEVIIPSFTFVSTVNAFVLRGARPVFADIRPDTLNMDESLLEGLITPRTRAIVPVHYAGVGCEMDAICSLAEASNIAVVEDNAHGLLGTYRGRQLGTFGALATQSFHETKNFSCGEGGALLVNDTELEERAEIIREKGTNRSRFLRGMVDKYTWVDVGSSYIISDILAAVLYAQLQAADAIQGARQAAWERYDEALAGWADAHDVGRPQVPAHCGQSFHMYYLLMPTAEASDKVRAFLRSRNILSVFHYLPLHWSPMGRSFGGEPGDCPVTESVSERLVRLPFFNTITNEEQTRVIAALHDFTAR